MSWADSQVELTERLLDAEREPAPVRPEDTPDALAFYARFEQTPDDGLPRRVFADWLEERGGTEPCRTCGGTGGTNATGYEGEQCPCCSGAGYVPDRTLRLARGYRALGEYGLYALHGTWYDSSEYVERKSLSGHKELPHVWFARLTGYTSDHAGAKYGYPYSWRRYLTKRAAEDAAALAWCAMTDAERERCDRELRGAQLTSTGELT